MSVPQTLDNTISQAARIFPLTVKPLEFISLNVSEQAIKQAAQLLGQKGGKVTSKAKARAARRNGKKGGRPRKTAA